MSYNIFIHSSIYNYGINELDKLKEMLDKVDKPRYHIEYDECGEMEFNIIIDEDFDRRHIKALLKYLESK